MRNNANIISFYFIMLNVILWCFKLKQVSDEEQGAQTTDETDLKAGIDGNLVWKYKSKV